MERNGSTRGVSLERSNSRSSMQRRGREASLPLDVEGGRPKSPKPEADGKLDRSGQPWDKLELRLMCA